MQSNASSASVKMNNVNKFILGLLCLFFSFNSYASLSNDDMRFQDRYAGGNFVGSEWIEASGRITSDTPQKFIEYLAKNNWKCYFVALNSGGGDLIAGIKLGRLFRKYGCTTWIGESTPTQPTPNEDFLKSGRCYSACAYAFLGGVERSIGKDDEYGVHQHYLEGAWSQPLEKTATAIDLTVSQFLTGALIEFVFEMGVDPKLVALASGVPPNRAMLLLSRQQQIDLKVVTDTPLPLESWSLVPMKDGTLAARLLQPAHSSASTTEAFVVCHKASNRLILVMSTDVDTKWISQLVGELKNREAAQDKRFGLTLKFQFMPGGAEFNTNYQFDVVTNNVRMRLWFPQQLGNFPPSVKSLSWEADTSRVNASFLRGEISLEGLLQLLPYVNRECVVPSVKQ